MAAFFQTLQKLDLPLRYGVIYLAIPLEKLNSKSDLDYKRLIGSPIITSWLKEMTGFDIEIVDVPEVERPTLMARRINVGNAGKNAMVKMPLYSESTSDIQRFAESVIDVMSTDEGDKVLTPEVLSAVLKSVNFNMDQSIVLSQSIAHDAHIPQKESLLSRFINKKKNSEKAEEYNAIFSDYFQDDEEIIDEGIIEDNYFELDHSALESAPSVIDDDEDEILTIEHEREQALNDIQAQILEYVTTYQADPKELIEILLKGKIVIGQNNRLSPLVVNKEMKIVLPYYNEVEVKMPAMCRAIYILFLKHPEGIALKDIADYRAELEDIYSMVMPGRSEEKAKEAIDNLLDPMSNTLNEYISKIKRCFKSRIINEELASNYIISGKRGEPYRVVLNPELITLPRAVTG